jgi:hypothetical protein
MLAEYKRAQASGKTVSARDAELDALVQQQLMDYKAGRQTGAEYAGAPGREKRNGITTLQLSLLPPRVQWCSRSESGPRVAAQKLKRAALLGSYR